MFTKNIQGTIAYFKGTLNNLLALGDVLDHLHCL